MDLIGLPHTKTLKCTANHWLLRFAKLWVELIG